MKLFALFTISTSAQREEDLNKVECPVPSWLNDTDVRCSNAHHGGSYCSTSCPPGYESFVTECNCGRYCKWTSGKPYCFDPAEYDYYGDQESSPKDNETTAKPETTTTTEEPTTVKTSTASVESSGDLSEFPPRRSERVKKNKEKEQTNECKKHDWFEQSSVTCTNGSKTGSKCQMIEGACKERYVTTVLTCQCQEKKGQQKCKWTVGPKDRPLNSKGPKCVRGNKKGVKPDSCKEEMWFKSSFVKCTNGLKKGSSCQLKNCDETEESNKPQCMCFERSKGVKKCRWNKKPKCKKINQKKKNNKEKSVDTEDAPNDEIFRRLPLTQHSLCPVEHWDYAEGITCTNGYQSGSVCKIKGTFSLISKVKPACSGKLVSTESACSCFDDKCTWIHADGTDEPTCQSSLIPYLNRPVTHDSQMLMDFVGPAAEIEEPEEEPEEVSTTPAPIDYTASNPNVCMKLPTDGVTLCSDRNRDGSFCRRMDCKSNETACLCSNGSCRWSSGAPICMEDADLASGCFGGSCDGCDMDDWMFEAYTECTNFNHEGSHCYRSNCYFPLASTRSKCTCTVNRRGDKFCYWDSIPLCFSPTLF